MRRRHRPHPAHRADHGQRGREGVELLTSQRQGLTPCPSRHPHSSRCATGSARGTAMSAPLISPLRASFSTQCRLVRHPCRDRLRHRSTCRPAMERHLARHYRLPLSRRSPARRDHRHVRLGRRALDLDGLSLRTAPRSTAPAAPPSLCATTAHAGSACTRTSPSSPAPRPAPTASQGRNGEGRTVVILGMRRSPSHAPRPDSQPPVPGHPRPGESRRT